MSSEAVEASAGQPTTAPRAPARPARTERAAVKNSRSRTWLLSLLVHAVLFSALVSIVPVLVRKIDPHVNRPLELVAPVESPQDRAIPELNPSDLPPADAPQVTIEFSEAPEVVEEFVAPAESADATEATAELAALAHLGAGHPLALRPRKRSAQPQPEARPGPTQSSAPVQTKPVGGGPTACAQVVGQIDPDYPPHLLQQNRTAKVLLEIGLDHEGRVLEVTVHSKDVHHDFVRASVAAAKRARYRPALENGKPVPGTIRVHVNFRVQ
ncbi:MAG: hypothetical protein AMXMBFR7_01490 [Planctomycetota bacterium]